MKTDALVVLIKGVLQSAVVTAAEEVDGAEEVPVVEVVEEREAAQRAAPMSFSNLTDIQVFSLRRARTACS